MTTPALSDDATVIVIDDDPGMRASLDSLMRSEGLQVITFSDPSDFLASDLPDSMSCLLLDIRLKTTNGLDFQEFLKKSGIILPVIIMTGHGDIPMTVRSMKAGAVDFLAKPFSDEALLQAVYTALHLSDSMRQNDKNHAAIRENYDTLTTREQEVIALVVTGLMNKQIAARLGVSLITVKIHRASAIKKMKADSLADLVRMAEYLGIRDGNIKRFNDTNHNFT